MDYSERILQLYEMARKDAVFADLTREYVRLEKQFEEVVHIMPTEAQDILWGYVCMGEELNYRLLELLLARMDSC